MGKTHYTAVLYYLFHVTSPQFPVSCLTLMDQKSSALTAVPYYSEA